MLSYGRRQMAFRAPSIYDAASRTSLSECILLVRVEDFATSKFLTHSQSTFLPHLFARPMHRHCFLRKCWTADTSFFPENNPYMTHTQFPRSRFLVNRSHGRVHELVEVTRLSDRARVHRVVPHKLKVAAVGVPVVVRARDPIVRELGVAQSMGFLSMGFFSLAPSAWGS